MKKLGTLIVLMLSITIARADAWDNLTKEQADQVVSFIEKNPFVFDYCDCCGTPPSLVYVTGTEIVPCSWQPEDYTVHYTGTVIAKIFMEERGGDPSNITPANDPFEGDIYMNYTWVYNKQFQVVAPFFDVIDYGYYGDDNRSCHELFGLPKAKLVGNKMYKKWYKQQ
ncbi:MAG: hypothetical protein MK078_07340 [Crocinitomicaceae bacterium]|nr:hypothetical protein [Crocinitomicaceae bacterium]